MNKLDVKLLAFNDYDEEIGEDWFECTNKEYIVQMFGLNKDGEKIKVILITKAAAEGLDFKNVRQIHIIDPWYNMNRIEQIIGRGVRTCSHKDLECVPGSNLLALGLDGAERTVKFDMPMNGVTQVRGDYLAMAGLHVDAYHLGRNQWLHPKHHIPSAEKLKEDTWKHRAATGS